MIPGEYRHSGRPSFDPNRRDSPVFSSIEMSFRQAFQLHVKAPAQIALQALAFGSAVSNQKLRFRVAIGQIGIMPCCGRITEFVGQAQRKELRFGRWLEFVVLGTHETLCDPIQNAVHKKCAITGRVLEQRLLFRVCQPLFLSPDLPMEFIEESAEQELNRRAQDYGEAKSIDQRRQPGAMLIVQERRSVSMTEQMPDVRGGEPHPPSVEVQAILILIFMFCHSS